VCTSFKAAAGVLPPLGCDDEACGQTLRAEDVRAECHMLLTEMYVRGIAATCTAKEEHILNAADRIQRRRWFANATKLLARRRKCGALLGGMPVVPQADSADQDVYAMCQQLVNETDTRLVVFYH
jgi:hypothetical protein